jgi:hypothetical protein
VVPKPDLTYVYAVIRTTTPHPATRKCWDADTILDLYASLDDANTRVRKEWEDLLDDDYPISAVKDNLGAEGSGFGLLKIMELRRKG